ncbi:MAG: arsenate reductase (glutaredoxin) [Bacteroidota bacterium]
MIEILHNNRCRKSREGLEYLQHTGKEFEVIEYLKHPISEGELIEILKKLKISPLELVRKNEAIWKSDYKNRDLTDAQIIKAMVDNPKLIERPVVINGSKAVIARPSERIDDLL